LKHYRPFRFTKDARLSCKITAILASLICAGCVVSTIALAQNTPPASASAASIDDALQKGKEAFLRKDYAAALNLFRTAADQGNAIAQGLMGDMYDDGLGVTQDHGQALSWYRKAADQGYAHAQNNLGVMYERGNGTPQDYGQAMIWYRKAADQSDANAQSNVGRMYRDGLGVAQDYAQAVMWYRKAADQGDANAKARLAQLEGHVTPATTNHAADNADAQAAFQFLERQLTASKNFLQQPEPGLSRLEKRDGDICKLTCGSHVAAGLDTVVDTEFEFAVSDMAPSTLKWEMDPNFKRAFVSFSSAAGTPVFRARGRSQKVEMPSFRPLSDWTKWNEWKASEKVICRSNPDTTDLDRVLRAFSVLAKACGAHQTPF